MIDRCWLIAHMWVCVWCCHRNLQVLQMETVSLAHESKEMEEKLQQLKESMSKEKEERGWVTVLQLEREERGGRLKREQYKEIGVREEHIEWVCAIQDAAARDSHSVSQVLTYRDSTHTMLLLFVLSITLGYCVVSLLHFKLCWTFFLIFALMLKKVFIWNNRASVS